MENIKVLISESLLVKKLFIFERILGAFIYFKMTLRREKNLYVCVIISRDFDLVVCVPIYEILLSLDEPIHTTHTTTHT